ncbi:CGNR zinc finger domain-containing protein [Streptomyces sp. NPDC050856]|uniref:CGNR zinc finger domain-containing protein n=1 Tax=Streptomyces sp. NPDC050856 TaxID=3154939 RepID=UPI0033C3993A
MPPPIEADPRPLTGEPLSIDLLNTRWIDAEGAHDLLETLDGLEVWLAAPAVRRSIGGYRDPGDAPGGDRPVPADRATLENVLRARAVLDELIADPDRPPPHAVDALNDVLAHGRVRRVLRPDGRPDTVVEVAEPSWLPAWSAAENWLRLMADRPERVRSCANDDCVLHFYDISRNGTRRWCSMAGCGNRAKAQRHYARHHIG